MYVCIKSNLDCNNLYVNRELFKCLWLCECKCVKVIISFIHLSMIANNYVRMYDAEYILTRQRLQVKINFIKR